MELPVVISVLMIMVGLFRLFLIRTGKFPMALGIQRYVPWVFIGAGITLLLVALLD